MREILFRGKRTYNGKWVFGYYVLLNEKNSRIYSGFAEHAFDDLYLECYNVDPETIGQYIGWKDKNGNKVFEGDIVRCENYHGQVMGIIDYSEVDKCFYLVCLSGYSDEYLLNCKNLEVIGNIHDSPELKDGENNAAIDHRPR